MAPNGTITVKVLRSPADAGGGPRYQAFQIEAFPRMSVLDALFTIQREHDRTLAFRYSCRVGMCGTCPVIINGREGLACQTLIERVRPSASGGRAAEGVGITLRPLNYLPVVKDLMVDMEPFFDRYRAVKPYFVPKELSARPQVIKQGEGRRKWVDPALGCISCGICYSACSVVGLVPDFPGPAALNRAYTLAGDERDAARKERLALVGGPNGVWRCHQQFSCANACPRHLVPTQAIRQLRMDYAASAPNPVTAPVRWLREKLGKWTSSPPTS